MAYQQNYIVLGPLDVGALRIVQLGNIFIRRDQKSKPTELINDIINTHLNMTDEKRTVVYKLPWPWRIHHAPCSQLLI